MATVRVERFYRQIGGKIADDRYSRAILIVAFGDSVTMGATAPDTIEPGLVYHRRLLRMLETRHPGAVFSVINAGVGGDTVGRALERIDRDVLRYRPDLVLVGFGLNDALHGEAGIPAFEAGLRAIADRIMRHTDADMVFLTPNFVASRASDSVVESQKKMLPKFMAIQNDGTLGRYAAAIRLVASSLGSPVADVYTAWDRLARRGVDTTVLLANGLNHPTGAAHAIAARCVIRAIMRD